MMRRRGTPFGRAEEGVTAIEFAIVMPVFLLLVFGVFEFGRAFWIWNTMQVAVDEGGRYAMINGSLPSGGPYGPGTPCSGTLASCAVSYARTQLFGLNPTDFNCASGAPGCVSATPNAGSSPATMTVTATYNFTSLVSLLNLAPLTLTRQVTVPLL